MGERVLIAAKWTLVCIAGWAATLPGALAQTAGAANVRAAYVPTMTFDVASVRESKLDPDRGFIVSGGFVGESGTLRVTNFSMMNLLMLAYPVDPHQIEGIPREFWWAAFNVEARTGAETDEELAKLTKEERGLEREHMVQTLLAERFNLKTHWETRDSATYELVVAKRGRLQSTGAPPSAAELKGIGDRPIPSLYQSGAVIVALNTFRMGRQRRTLPGCFPASLVGRWPIRPG